jgi:sulfite exporter TauE/SafE
MNQDAEHLRVLSIFHYVVAGLAAFCSLFPLLYTVMGFVFVALSHHPPTNPTQQPQPAALGWAFVVFGIFLFLLGVAFANRSGFCRSLAFRPKALLVRIRRWLYRMHLCAVRDDSWSVHDYRAVARITENVVLAVHIKKCSGLTRL